ncbi:hypothetical protein CS022_03435 [Veronia nyctiphanis]|uniref:Glycoside hydrolase family 13 N-terminal domain-containing protein n=1 Tax=Veronia nyctiphanis TaxID=1278244 RepID=A0A4Q0YTQ1_9GAMM|nr:hypothetical protein [Veronia nyctiphanis]RXJ74627.1 hypothetical protein CS022_03435 [Veronia nyctiphanis]
MKNMDNKTITHHKVPQGATLSENGCFFSIHAPQVNKLKLAIFDHNGTPEFHDLGARNGPLFQIFLPNIKSGTQYSYFYSSSDKEVWLIDPYAKKISAHPVCKKSYASVVTNNEFDWQGVVQPTVGRDQTLVYEVHVKGLTQQHPDIPEPFV